MGNKTFGGAKYDTVHDHKRLTRSLKRVKTILFDNEWVTLEEIQQEAIDRWGETYLITGISARVRDLRKDRFGAYTVNSRRRGDLSRGLHEYKLEK